MLTVRKTFQSFYYDFDVHSVPFAVTQRFDYVFSENGLVVHKNGELTSRQVFFSVRGQKKCFTFRAY